MRLIMLVGILPGYRFAHPGYASAWRGSPCARRANHSGLRFNADRLVQPSTKNIPLFRNKNQAYGLRVPHLTRGVRVVTNVERNAVDVNVPIDVRHICGRRSRVVLARPCRRQVGDNACALR